MISWKMMDCEKFTIVPTLSLCIFTARLISRFVTRVTQRVPLVEQELLTLLEHMSSPPVFSGVHITRSLVLCTFVYVLEIIVCTFSFGHCVVCSSSIYGFWLPLWYLQTLLDNKCPILVWSVLKKRWIKSVTRYDVYFVQCRWWMTRSLIFKGWQVWNEIWTILF